MLEEAPDEFHDLQAGGAIARASLFAVLERNGAIPGSSPGQALQGDDPAVGDGHFEHIRGQVLERSGPVSDGLAVDDPVDLPNLGVDLVQEAGFLHLVFEFFAVDGRERARTGT